MRRRAARSRSLGPMGPHRRVAERRVADHGMVSRAAGRDGLAVRVVVGSDGVV